MSNKAITLVKGRTTGSATRKAVLLVLADYADEAWSCFPSQETIAAETELGIRTVRRTLASLEADGLIQRTMRKSIGGFRTSDRIALGYNAIAALPVAGAARDFLPATDARLPATDGQTYRPEEPGNPHMNPQEPQLLAAQALPDAPDEFPSKSREGLTYSRTVAAWLREQGVEVPKAKYRDQAYRMVVEQLDAILPGSDRTKTGKAIAVISDYVVEFTEAALDEEARSHLGRIVKGYGPVPAFDAVAEAVAWGAGIGGEHAKDPRAITKYALRVLTARREAA